MLVITSRKSSNESVPISIKSIVTHACMCNDIVLIDMFTVLAFNSSLGLISTLPNDICSFQSCLWCIAVE